MLIAKENVVENESRQARAKEATEAVQGAERFKSWESQTIETAQL
jgi:hypothetical protein